MVDATGELLALAVGVAISPLPIMPVVLLLGSPRGRTSGPAFAAGWVLGLVLVGVVVLALAPEPDGEGPERWVGVVKLLLGLALLALAVRTWRGRPRGDVAAAAPSWMGAVESLTPPRAFGTALLLAANPKNLVLVLAATTAIVEADLPPAEQAAAYAVFALIGSVGVVTPVVLLFSLGESAGGVLSSLNAWLARNNALILTIVLLLLGVTLVGDALAIL